MLMLKFDLIKELRAKNTIQHCIKQTTEAL